MFKQYTIAAIAAMSLVAAGPALASGKGKTDGTNAAPAKEQSAPASNKKVRYCLRAEPVTGSIASGRVCKTADQWRAEGIDPENLPSRN